MFSLRKMFLLEKFYSWKNAIPGKMLFLEKCYSWKNVIPGKCYPWKMLSLEKCYSWEMLFLEIFLEENFFAGIFSSWEFFSWRTFANLLFQLKFFCWKNFLLSNYYQHFNGIVCVLLCGSACSRGLVWCMLVRVCV